MTPKPSHESSESFKKLQDFTRRVLGVPKQEIDRKLVEEKAKKKQKRR